MKLKNKIFARAFLFAAFLFSLFVSANFAQSSKLVSHKISLTNGSNFTVNLPAGYEIVPALEGLRRVRFFAKAPDNRIFVTDMFDMSDNRKGTVYILDGWNAATGKFKKAVPFMTNLRNPNSVAFYTDARGQSWFYLAETDKLTRYKYTKNSLKPTGKPQILARFPDYGLDYKYGGWHLTRTLAFSPKGKLYVSVGSSCNSCVEKTEERDVRAVILEMNPNGTGRRVFARNLRNAVGLRWVENTLFATNQGVDHLGLDKPDETFYALKDGANYGWAQCYQSNGKLFFDTKYLAPNQKKAPSCNYVPASYAYFPAHSSALGFDYFNAQTEDAVLKNSFLVALHGSTDRDNRRGYKIVIVRKGAKPQDFLTGFLQGKNVYGRPCDIIKISPESFLFTDDRAGVVYFVRRIKK